jgi:peptidyl-prolyl cis-trans isomerase C
MTIRVNGVEISGAAIHAEMQHHPAATASAAMREAAQALVVRELLLQEAARLGLAPAPATTPAPAAAGEERDGELPEEALIARLIEREVRTPEAGEDECRRYYDANRRRFRSPELFDAQHILCAAAPDDEAARAAAKARAEGALRDLAGAPERFAELARTLSDCSSSTNGGSLGQVTRGSTVPEFETFLMSLDEGETCAVPVETRYGFHVVRLNRRAPGRELPFDAVRDQVAAFLADSVWRRAVHQYVMVLAGRAAIEGIAIQKAASPLVQ